MSTLDYLKHSFKNELIAKRAELDLSQEEMAERLNISLRSYSNLEHGICFCSALSLINFVNNCNVDKDKLFAMFEKIINDANEHYAVKIVYYDVIKYIISISDINKTHHFIKRVGFIYTFKHSDLSI